MEATVGYWIGQSKHLHGQQAQIVTIYTEGDMGPREEIIKFNAMPVTLYLPSLSHLPHRIDLCEFHYGAFLVSGFH